MRLLKSNVDNNYIYKCVKMSSVINSKIIFVEI